MYTNHATYVTYRSPGEKFTKPSLTVPDQYLSLDTLLTRYTRTGNLQILPGGVYTEDPAFEGIERMDALEKAELAQQVGALIEQERQRRAAPKPPQSPTPPEPPTAGPSTPPAPPEPAE